MNRPNDYTREHTITIKIVTPHAFSPRLMQAAIINSLNRGGFHREFSRLEQATIRHEAIGETKTLDPYNWHGRTF